MLNPSLSEKVQSKTKVILILLIGISFTLSIIEFIIASVNGYTEALFMTTLSVALDGILLLAIFKQWKTVLKIFRFIIIVVVVLCVLSVIAGITVLVGGDTVDKEQIADDIITVTIGALTYSLLAYLLKKYLAQISVSEQFSYNS
jgi:hypothetical protein